MDCRLMKMLLFLMLVAPSVYAKEGDDIEAARIQPVSFQLSIEPIDTFTVDGAASFVINRPDEPFNPYYSLYFYLDNRLEDSFSAIKLPYVFQQTFAGLVDGNYKMQFVLIDRDGKVGRVEQMVHVQHKK